MKFTVVMLFATFALFAAEVSMETAEALVKARMPGGFRVSERLILEGDGFDAGYAFLLEPGGFFITPSDDRLPPVIAYSVNNGLFDRFGESPMLELAVRDLTARHAVLELLPDNSGEWTAPPGPLPEQWPPEGSTPTGGWLEENWTQNAPYNQYCPMDLIAGVRSLAGCPAVAMGSILNFHMETNGTRFDDTDDYYHNYHEYYWIDDDSENHDFPSWSQLNLLLDTLEAHYALSVITPQDKAALVYASGAACRQVYTGSVSGTFGVNQAFDGYVRFGFQSCELLGESSDSLMERLSQNMMNAMPAHLAIVDEGPTYGHNVVLDGYNTDGFFHINFGWGGSSNGWYSFPLTGMPYGMNIIEGVVVDIGQQAQSAGGEQAGETLFTTPVANPAGLSFTVGVSSPVTVSVYSVNGRLMEETPADRNNPAVISTENYSAGVYVLRAADGVRVDRAVFTVLR